MRKLLEEEVGRSLGIRNSFPGLTASIADFFGVPPLRDIENPTGAV